MASRAEVRRRTSDAGQGQKQRAYTGAAETYTDSSAQSSHLTQTMRRVCVMFVVTMLSIAHSKRARSNSSASLTSATGMSDYSQSPNHDNVTRVAVCILGLERSFHLISRNIEGLLLSLRTIGPVHVFGVRPVNDEWRNIFGLLQQKQLVANATFEQQGEHNLTSPTLFRPIRSSRSFMIELWDCAHCYTMIQANEAKENRTFQVVARVRPDLFWESFPIWPTSFVPQKVHLPRMSYCHGVNDKFAIGGRLAMATYLSRVYHLPFQGGGAFESEVYLDRVLSGMQVSQHYDWMFCKMGHADNLTKWKHESHSAWAECSTRIFERIRCERMVCGWCGQGCRCWNHTCSEHRIIGGKELCHEIANSKHANASIPPGFKVKSQLLLGDAIAQH